MQPVHIRPDAAAAMHALAQEHRPLESCAFLEGTGRTVHRIHPTPNTHAEPQTRYAVDPLAYLDLEEALEGSGREVVGVFHSHPASVAVPSATDRAHAQVGWTYLILGYPPAHPDGELRAWHLTGQDADFQELPIQVNEVVA